LFAAGSVIAAGSGSTVLGQKDQQLGVMYDPDSEFIDVLKGVVDVTQLTEEFSKVKENKTDILAQTTFSSSENFDLLQFRFLASDKYGDLTAAEDGIPMTLAQQDDLLTGSYSLKEWKEKLVNDTYPYPGKDLFEKCYYSSKAPVNLEANNAGKDYSSKADSSEKPAEISLESLNNYKVQS
jgi:hypothetical protein